MITPRKSIFDTRFDTAKLFMTPNYKFSLRSNVTKEGKSLIYLDVSDSNGRIRFNTEIYVYRETWDPKTQRVKKSSEPNKKLSAQSTNIILDNIEAKLIGIKTECILRELSMDAKTFIEKFQNDTPEFDFISFYRHKMALEDVKVQTAKNYKSVLHKLIEFQPEIPFHKITLDFFKRYRKFHKKNSEVTYHTDLKNIKKFLRIAQKEGIPLNIDLDDLKVNVESNSVVYLLPTEVNQLIKYYYNEFINPSHILPLGYFLFSCYTGLRISDVQLRTRAELLEDSFQFISKKTETKQRMKLNADARKLLEHRPELFDKKLVDQKINFHLKKIAEVCKINKKLTTHVGRHTFATTFYRKTKDIYALKRMLGHANIKHTLSYVHLVEGEDLHDIDLVTY